MDKVIVNDPEWATNLQNGVVEYTDSLIESVFEGTDDVHTLSGEVFCGCDTCFWREALFFLVPAIIEGYKTGKLSVDEE